MTIDELRVFCLGLPGTTEKETWGDAGHGGDVTFRVKDKIYLITGPDGGGATIRTTVEQQADLIAAFPASAKVASYVGRFGWVHVGLVGPEGLDDEVVRETVRSAWRRTIPKAMLRGSRRRRRERGRCSGDGRIPHTNDTAGARLAAEGFAHARAGGRSALIPYVVAGYPDADASFQIACAAIDAGADLLEVGLPYSDPLADGATLQRASQGALAAGATFDGRSRSSRGSPRLDPAPRSCRWATRTS